MMQHPPTEIGSQNASLWAKEEVQGEVAVVEQMLSRVVGDENVLIADFLRAV